MSVYNLSPPRLQTTLEHMCSGRKYRNLYISFLIVVLTVVALLGCLQVC